MNIIDSHFLHVLAFTRISKILAFTKEGYLSFKEIHAFLFPSVSVAHHRLVNQVQSARIRLVLARLDEKNK